MQNNDENDVRPKSQFYKYAAINFAFFITMTFNGYVVVFLQSIGFNAQQVGTITALNSGVGIFASPFWGTLSDKLRSLKKVIILALTVASLLFVLVPFVSRLSVWGISLLFVLLPVTMFFRMPLMSLIDNWMLRNARAEKLNYGSLRAYGALSFALAAFALGYIIPLIGVDYVFYISIIFALPAIYLMVFVKGSEDDAASAKKSISFKEMQIGQLFKNYYLITYIIFTIFLRIPFQGSMIFLPFLIDEVGGDIAQLGIIMGLRALVEIPVMMIFNRLRQRFPLYMLIIVSAALFAVEFILYSTVSTFTMVIALSMLHGVANGLTIPAGASYVFSLAPEHLKATAQTIMASTTSIAGILGGLIGGLLIAMFSIMQFYLVIGIMLALATILYAASFTIGERLLKIKKPGLSLL